MSDISIYEKLEALGLSSTVDIPNKYIEQLYDLNFIKAGRVVLKSKEVGVVNARVKKDFDYRDPKNKILLKILNRILSYSKLKNISNIYDFREVDEYVIVSAQGSNKHANYILVFLRNACRELGTEFSAKQKRTSNRSEEVYKTVYSII